MNMKVNLLKQKLNIMNKTFEDVIDENSCRYALGEINDPPKYFCGEIRYANSPYCKVHLVICTNKEKT